MQFDIHIFSVLWAFLIIYVGLWYSILRLPRLRAYIDVNTWTQAWAGIGWLTYIIKLSSIIRDSSNSSYAFIVIGISLGMVAWFGLWGSIYEEAKPAVYFIALMVIPLMIYL